jgi:hypothetical protein
MTAGAPGAASCSVNGRPIVGTVETSGSTDGVIDAAETGVVPDPSTASVTVLGDTAPRWSNDRWRAAHAV